MTTSCANCGTDLPSPDILCQCIAAEQSEAPPRTIVRAAPDAPDCTPVRPPASALPNLLATTSTYLSGAPRISYAYARLNAIHSLRIDSLGHSLNITITHPEDAHRLLLDLEQAARGLRRRLDLPEDA